MLVNVKLLEATGLPKAASYGVYCPAVVFYNKLTNTVTQSRAVDTMENPSWQQVIHIPVQTMNPSFQIKIIDANPIRLKETDFAVQDYVFSGAAYDVNDVRLDFAEVQLHFVYQIAAVNHPEFEPYNTDKIDEKVYPRVIGGPRSTGMRPTGFINHWMVNQETAAVLWEDQPRQPRRRTWGAPRTADRETPSIDELRTIMQNIRDRRARRHQNPEPAPDQSDDDVVIVSDP